MSATHAATVSSAPLGERKQLVSPQTLAVAGIALIAVTGLGGTLITHDYRRLGYSWLIALTFWIAVSIGILMLTLIHHIFDAEWSTVVRRTYEHWLSCFKWLFVLFVPLLVTAYTNPGVVWQWMDPKHVATDVVYAKKSGFLNVNAFLVATVVFFGIWIWLSARLRKASFAQDVDGSPEHTLTNRFTAGMGIPLGGLSLTFAAFYWLMSLEHHWFSTMYGVWFFASCIRAGLAVTMLLCLYLTSRGVLDGIFTKAHMLSMGNLMLAFVVFWAYVTFSQYFLIWNANVPEETFWYNVRESGNWEWVGYTLVFGHFLLPFLFYLQHPLKKMKGPMVFISIWVLSIILLDFYYNILPAIKVPGEGETPIPFGISPWDVTAVAGIGCICLWSFFRSFATQRCIPVRDPRIAESLNLHE